jgi:cell division septum initiation protein DivIVA
MDENRVPFSNKIMVEEVQVLRIVDQMRAGMPNEFIEARRVLGNQSKIIRSAQLEAEKILQRATQQAEYLLSQHGLMLEAQQRAERMLEEARLYQQRAQNDIDRYGLQRLQQVEEAIRESARLMTGSIDDSLASIQDARERVLPSDNDE